MLCESLVESSSPPFLALNSARTRPTLCNEWLGFVILFSVSFLEPWSETLFRFLTIRCFISTKSQCHGSFALRFSFRNTQMAPLVWLKWGRECSIKQPSNCKHKNLNVVVRVWSVTEQTLPPETAASSSDQARNKPRNNQQDQRRVHLSWRHNTWSETRSLCLLNSFERALPNAASSLCFLQCCAVRLPGTAAVVFFISLVDHFLSLFF